MLSPAQNKRPLLIGCLFEVLNSNSSTDRLKHEDISGNALHYDTNRLILHFSTHPALSSSCFSDLKISPSSSNNKMVFFFTSTGKRINNLSFKPTRFPCNSCGTTLHDLYGSRQIRKYVHRLRIRSIVQCDLHRSVLDNELLKYCWPEDVWCVDESKLRR
jgi:hypothetical protein